MITKGKKGFAKRILAMLMTLLMVWSLVPANAYVVLAAEEATYSFTLKNVDEEAISGAQIAFYSTYNPSGVENENVKIDGVECTESDTNAGTYSVTTDQLEKDYWYVITVENYEVYSGQITSEVVDETETITTTYEVTLTAKAQEPPVATTIVVDGTVVTAGTEEGPNVPVADATVTLSVGDVVKYTATTDAEGKYTFDAVEVDVEYTFTIKHNDYKSVSNSFSLNGVADAYTIAEQVLAVKDTLNLEFTENAEFVVVIGNGIDNPVKFSDELDAELVAQLLSYVTYSSDKEDVAVVDSTGKVTTKAISGDDVVTITATFAGHDTYADTSLTYTINVIPKTAVVLNFDIETLILKYGDTSDHSYIAYVDVQDLGVIVTYSSSDESVVTVDEDGNLTIEGLGTATITATIEDSENIYDVTMDSYDVTVEKGNQNISVDYREIEAIDGVTVQNSQVDFTTLHISDSAIGKIPVVGVVDNATVEYSSSDSEIVAVDENGYLTIKASGTAIITVNVVATEFYNEASVSYTVVVSKVDAELVFEPNDYFDEESQKYVATNGDKNFVIPVLSYNENATGTIVYSIKSGDSNVIKDFNTSDGTYTLNNTVGEVTIQVSYSGDTVYDASTVEYTLVVEEWKVTDEMYVISGTQVDVASGWYTSAELVVDAAENYLVSKDGITWDETVTFTLAEGTNNSISFYVKDDVNGYVSDVYTVDSIKVDTSAPTANIVKDDITWFDQVISFFTFGLLGQDNVEFTVETASDDVKGIYYYVEDFPVGQAPEAETVKEELDKFTEWIAYDQVIEITPELAGGKVIYAKVVDNAGNYSYAYTNGLIFDGVKPTVTTEIKTTKNENGYYTGDVAIKITEAKDASPASGIYSITYVVKCNGNETQSGSLFTFEPTTLGNPDYSELIYEWTSEKDYDILVDASRNNSDNVVVEITITDNAGNSSTETINLKIAAEKPVIADIVFENDPTLQNTLDNVDYYKDNRVAKIVITSENRLFVEDNVVIGAPEGTYTISEWTTSVDGNEHIAYVTFTGDAKYAFTVDYTNKAGVSADQKAVERAFVVDKTVPQGTLAVGSNQWNALVEILTFGLWKNTKVEVVSSFAEDVTPVQFVGYYLHEGTTKLTTSQLENVQWESSIAPIDEEKIFVVYMKMIDYAGNENIISTDGIIIDTTVSNIAINYNGLEPNANGYFNANVPLIITVEEVGAANSGVASVSYSLVHNGQVLYTEEIWNYLKEQTEAGLYMPTDGKFAENHPLYTELKQTVQMEIEINAEDYNHDDLYVVVTAVDNAGVKSVYDEFKVNIDVTAPTVDLSFNVNSGKGDYINGFFDNKREAEIVVTERVTGFNAENAMQGLQFIVKDRYDATTSTTVTVENAADYGIFIGEWDTVDNTENPDLATHALKVVFTGEYYYEWVFTYTDNAGNVNEEIQYPENTNAPYAFTVDTEKPVNLKVIIDSTSWDESWEDLWEVITFGLFKNDKVTVLAEANDVTSDYVIQYLVTSDTVPRDKETLDLLGDDEWKTYTGSFEISEEQKVVIYLKVTDTAGNYEYIHSNGAVVDWTQDATIAITPDAPNANGVYKTNFNVLISVDDSDISSGIKEVEYWVTADGIETQRDKWFPSNLAELDVLAHTVTIKAEENNSSDVKLYVKVTDNAGNVITTEPTEFDIDVDKPVIEVVYDSLEPVKVVDGKGYYNNVRTAIITVTELNAHFDVEEFINSITVTRDGTKVTLVSDREIAETDIVHIIQTDDDLIDDKHIFTITYQADGNYELAIDYKDRADNPCEPIQYPEGTITSFAVDTTSPTGKITLTEKDFWTALLETITFGLWSDSEVTVKISGQDTTSPIDTIYYYKTSEFTPYDKAKLKSIKDWVEGTELIVGEDDIFVVYAKIVDYAGNVTYIGSNGIIVDTTKPTFESITPQVTITPQQPVNGIYNKDVIVDVKVVEPGVKNEAGVLAYSGLKSISYAIYDATISTDKATQTGVLFTHTPSSYAQTEMVTSWNGEDIVVKADLNNSNNVKVVVTAIDNAGNTTVETVVIKIDTTRPTIDISYDNNVGDTTFADGVYFDANRVATITITERNFDPNKVSITLKNSDGVVPKLSEWKTVNANGNGDNTTHTATLTYTADGDYTFDIAYSDNAGNISEAADYGDSLAPTEFTIDKTLPVISVEYDNNDVLNGNYYKADRLATITITEHNFDASRVVVTLAASDDGETITAPVISDWKSSGDTHTATISYDEDALYTFDIEYVDKAGNAAADFTQQRFYVDKTAPTVTITGIVDQSANNAEVIGFVITSTDTNFDEFKPVLSAVVKTDNGFTTKELEAGAVTPVDNGKRYTVSNIDTDGIYRITCTVVDKAGNAYTEVTLQGADGQPYVEALTSSNTLVSFSVNRGGSTFEADENTSEVVKNFYVYDISEDIVIVEVNTDALASYEVTLNGVVLTEGADYSVATDGGNGAWMKYTYTLNKSLFMAEGEYTVVVSSTDKAENNAFSDVKDTKISFVVDRTAPVVTITGMQDGGRYQTDNVQTVTLIPTDDGGALGSVLVQIVDDAGNVVKVLKELSGEALEEALAANGTITFDIEKDDSGSQIIEVVCTDKAVNADGTANVYTAKYEVVVASSGLALVWADTTLRYTIIGISIAVLVLLTGTIVFVVRRKAKKDKMIIRK